MSEFKWTDSLVSDFYIFMCQEHNMSDKSYIERFKELHSNTHTVKADESNVVDGGSKDWEVLSFLETIDSYTKYIHHLRPDGKYSFDNNTFERLISHPDYKIHSVKRLSDEEIISVGENRKEGEVIKITYSDDCGLHIHIRNKKVLPYDYPFKISEIEKQKPILFTTEDGKAIYHGDKYYWINTSYESYWEIFEEEAILGKGDYNFSIIKFFSTKEAANTYILYNKPCLSVNDLMDYVMPNSKTAFSGDTYFALNGIRLKELVKSKINK